MSPFVMKITLGSPIIPGRRLLLDGLLSALIYEMTGSVAEAHSTIPLDRSHGVWSGSQAFLEGNPPLRNVNVCGSLRADFDVTPDMIRPNGKRKDFPAIYSNKGNYQNSFSEYTTFEAQAVWFCGTGDVEAVRGLMAGVTGIGTKRSVGYGQVTRVDIRAIEGSNVGLVLADGSPARSVPVDAWRKISNRRALLNSERFQPPYWQGEYALCAVPAPVAAGTAINRNFLAA